MQQVEKIDNLKNGIKDTQKSLQRKGKTELTTTELCIFKVRKHKDKYELLKLDTAKNVTIVITL